MRQNNYQNKVVIYFSIVLFIARENNWYLFFVGSWYTTMNATLFINPYPIILISVRNLLYCSITTILLKLFISSRLMIRSLLLSTIIIGGSWCFSRIPIELWFNFTIVVWFMLYKKLIIMQVMNKLLRRIKLMISILICILMNCLWKFYTYANWWKVLLIAGLVPKILISSYFTDSSILTRYTLIPHKNNSSTCIYATSDFLPK